MNCWLAQFSDKPCSGRLVRAHLIPRQLVKREFSRDEAASIIANPASWVPACGGPMGNGGHHGMADYSRTLKIPREALPKELEDLAEELGLGWWLAREYGPLEAAGMTASSNQRGRR